MARSWIGDAAQEGASHTGCAGVPAGIRRDAAKRRARVACTALLAATTLACTPTPDRTAELTAREAGNPGGENYGEFGPPDAYEGDSPHPFYGAENEWSRRMFDERSADLYYKRRGQRQLLEILDGNPTRAIELADARLAADPADAESHFVRAVALTRLDRIDEAEAAMQAALDAGMPFGRFLAGPRDLLAPLAATATFALHAAGPNNEIVHGPMLGAVTETTASVWVRTAEETGFEVVATADGERHTASGATTADRDYTGTATLAGLSPDTTYSYQVLVDAGTPPAPQPQSQPQSHGAGAGVGAPAFRPAQPQATPQSQSPTYTLRTAPPPGTPGTVTIAFGGCAGYTPANERMWDTIATHSPQALLLLGDNVYVDLPEQPGPFHDYTYYQRQSRPEFRRLVSATPVYAVWDDHDAAVDDIWLGPYVDRPAWKQPMVEHFRRNWNNPASGSASHPGVWFRFSLGDVDFFLLDGRTYRTNPFVEERTMLGPVQKDWLLDGLRGSEATFKVIASPVAWADGAKPGSRDTWSGFPEEREEILRFVEENDVTGVVLLSSDRHRSEAWAIERESGYAFHDLLSGQLTNIHTHPVEPGALFSYNLKDSFGLLTFETAGEEPRVTYEIYSIDDELIETLVIPHADLAVTKESV
ncbi:MAG: alkaline phosphatase D family protein [Acidobacteriota bacterium]|nr:alkaline phosphatase D family protein [Acidobacteriota bacterium]MDE3266748.1 alkaline phosphatase D family protein [Acidobacteriota bacterium]